MSGFERYPPILDVPGVADLLGLSIAEVRRLSGEGWMPSAKVDGRWYYRRDEVLEWLRAQQVMPPADDEPGSTSGV